MSKSILKRTTRRSPQLNSNNNGSEGSTTSVQSTTEGSDSDSSLHCTHSTLDGLTRPVSISLHHVHFASDTSIYLTHSTADYDRTPMKVMKNPCAMPARGCPGLTYVNMDDGPGGRQRGVRDLEAAPNCMDGSTSADDEGSETDESERAEYGVNPMGESRDRPCQRYALKVSAQRRRRKMNDEEEDVLHLGGFRSLSAFSSLVTSPNDCFGGF